MAPEPSPDRFVLEVGYPTPVQLPPQPHLEPSSELAPAHQSTSSDLVWSVIGHCSGQWGAAIRTFEETFNGSSYGLLAYRLGGYWSWGAEEVLTWLQRHRAV